MKKFFVLIPILMLCLTGCGSNSGTLKCTLESKDAVNDYSLSSTYTVNYKKGLVESVDTVEEVSSDSEDVLDTFEDTLNETYSKMNDTYGGYDYKVTKSDGKVTSKVTIDYNKMDLDQFTKDQPALKNYIKDGKLKIEGLKSMYESMGATCE